MKFNRCNEKKSNSIDVNEQALKPNVYHHKDRNLLASNHATQTWFCPTEDTKKQMVYTQCNQKHILTKGWGLSMNTHGSPFVCRKFDYLAFSLAFFLSSSHNDDNNNKSRPHCPKHSHHLSNTIIREGKLIALIRISGFQA